MMIFALMAAIVAEPPPERPPSTEAMDIPSRPAFRIVSPPGVRPDGSSQEVTTAESAVRFQMTNAVAIGRQWGRVTSTLRTPEHNRRVGGVRNSYHLRNRAIDIARNPGVSHRQIDQAYRRAGYILIESLDEGDHSHFAFADGPMMTASSRTVLTVSPENERADRFHVVLAPPTR